MTVAQRVEATRAYLAVAALAGAALVFLAFRNLHPVFGLPLALIAAAVLLGRWRGVFSRRRVMLWLEERLPELRYSLVAVAYEPETRFRDALEARVREVPAARVLAIAGLKLVGVPVLVLLTAQLVLRPILERVRSGDGPSGRSIFGRARDAAGRDATFSAIVTPPAYVRGSADTVRNPVTVTALVGSQITFIGRWTGRATMPKRPTVLRLQAGNQERMVALEPRTDSIPRVVLDLPARDTVLPVPRGTISLSASARDDIGLVSGWFEMIVSSGSGESFAFRTAQLSQTPANGSRELRLATALRLDTLGLKPGDIVHLRAVARDANNLPDAEAGSSETRTLRVFRVGESDSVSVEVAPPPEVGKSELSQRMLIILTEKLVAQTRKLTREAMLDESQTIGRDQGRLRKRVGQIIFTRLTGEEPDEDSTKTAVGSDSLSPAEALLKAASDATGANVGELQEAGEEDSPIIGVNRPLLEAYNSMWEAERRLGVGEPREALPHMNAALAAIQKARAAERLYLRGRPPKIVLDIARIRLSGKREGVDPVGRSPRASVVAAMLARQARFGAALELLSRERASGAAAAIDSLVLLRVDALADQPRAAAALGTAIEDLRSGKDATSSLREARRALVGSPETGKDPRWSGAW